MSLHRLFLFAKITTHIMKRGGKETFMMIFGIDVRRRICKKYMDWMEIVNLKAEMKQKKEAQSDEKTEEKFDKIIELLDEILEDKVFEMKLEIDQFELDFAKDVFENRDFYKYRIEDKKEA